MNPIAVFLRGINLGRRRLTGDELVRPFRIAGFEGARSYQASGNVVIDPLGVEPAEIEVRVERAMREGVGFEADAFARPLTELSRIVREPVIVEAEAEGFIPHVIFLKGPPGPPATAALAELETPDDRFPALTREFVWLRRGRLSDSTIQPHELERALNRVPSTMRKITTLRRMVKKFGG